MFNFLNKYLSVDAIVKDFQVVINRLEAVAQQAAKKAEAKSTTLQKLEAEIEAHKLEWTKAQGVKAKIESLIS